MKTAVRTIHLAHSPDADDAFMFWAMAAGRIDTQGRRYIHELADIETLNRRALAGELEVTAVSIHAYAHLAARYALLAHGASVGDRYGPRVVAREPAPADPRRALAGRLVAIPGELTTAFLTLRLYQPDVRYEVVPFDQIEEYVAGGRADAGLLGDELIHAVARDLKASIEYGLAHRDEALRHARGFSRGLDAARTDRFVGMYVNAYTIDYGESGRRAISVLLERAHRAGLIPAPVPITFVPAAG